MTCEESAFKIKTGNLPVLLLHILTTDMVQLKHQLTRRLSQTPDFFTSTPIALELSAIAKSSQGLDYAELVSFMLAQGMCAAGVVGGSAAQRDAAVQAGLGLFPEVSARNVTRRAEEQSLSVTGQHAALLCEQPELPEPTAEISPQLVESEQKISIDEPVPLVVQAAVKPTMVIDKPVRTGQRIYAEGANLVVLAIVNAGAELIADGDIHVYATMRGKAIAGARGNESARIFVQGLEAELLSIGGCFKIFEEGIPEIVRGKPAQIHLNGSHLVILPLLQ